MILLPITAGLLMYLYLLLLIYNIDVVVVIAKVDWEFHLNGLTQLCVPVMYNVGF